MLEALAKLDPSDRTALHDALMAHLHRVSHSPRGDRTLVARAEAQLGRDPSACFQFDAAGHATLRAADRTFQAGRFETPTLGELRRRVDDAAGRTRANARLHVVDGASPATDIGALQATAPRGSLFQVASQFNCLESPSALVVPVFEYFHDGTQGPRASISAFPGTLLRHYGAPAADGTRFVQTDAGPQINLLEAACAPGVAFVRSGYLRVPTIARPDLFARALEERFDDLRVGVHDDVEVVYGYDWDGPVPDAPHLRIAQVFTSTLAAGGYGQLDPSDATMLSIVRQLLRAAYLGTLLGAASLGKSHVVLTLIGGGVFGNPIPIIWESILWAFDAVAPLVHRDLDVVVNGYALGRRVSGSELHAAAAARGGTMAVFDEDSVRVGA